MQKRKDATECVSALAFRVEVALPGPQAAQRWEQRAETLARWLLSEFQRERDANQPVPPQRREHPAMGDNGVGLN